MFVVFIKRISSFGCALADWMSNGDCLAAACAGRLHCSDGGRLPGVRRRRGGHPVCHRRLWHRQRARLPGHGARPGVEDLVRAGEGGHHADAAAGRRQHGAAHGGEGRCRFRAGCRWPLHGRSATAVHRTRKHMSCVPDPGCSLACCCRRLLSLCLGKGSFTTAADPEFGRGAPWSTSSCDTPLPTRPAAHHQHKPRIGPCPRLLALRDIAPC